MADKAETPTPPAAEKAGGGSKLPVIVGGLNAALTAGVLALLVLRGAPAGAPAPDPHAPVAVAEGGHGETAPADAPAEGGHGEKGAKGAAAGPRPGPVLNLPDFVVHLRDPDSDRYARLTFDVEVKDDAGKEALTAHLPQVRDAFLAYLSDRSVEELRGSEGLALVKGDLTKKLAEIAPSVPVKALYVTELVVQ